MDYRQFDGHTPPPWDWCGNSIDQTELPYAEVMSDEVYCGAYCLGGMWSPGLSDADRALIKAAPELLEENKRLKAALERALPWLGRLIADGGHLNSVAPNDAIGAMEQADAALYPRKEPTP